MSQLLSTQPCWFHIELARKLARSAHIVPSAPDGASMAVEFLYLYFQDCDAGHVARILPLIHRKTVEARVFAHKWDLVYPNASKDASALAMLLAADCREMVLRDTWVHCTTTSHGQEFLLHHF